MKKKVFCLMLCLCLCLGSLAGCGNNETNQTTTPTPTMTVAPTEKAEPTPTTAAEPTLEPTAEPTPEPTPEVVAEAVPDAKYHWALDGDDAGLLTVVQVDKTQEQIDNADFGGAFDIAESTTYTDKDGNVMSADLLYADGPVGKCLYLNGSYGVKLSDFAGVEDDTYSISFWVNADRLSTYGPTLQLGHNIAYNSHVGWINFTQSEWGTNSAKIFPVVWNRNSDDNDAFPWFYSNDDAVHGKREWLHITLVADGQTYVYGTGETAYDLVNSTLYINGVQTFCSDMSAYGGMATNILSGDYGFEAYLGINYWDTIFKGFFDDIYIFDEALTAGQVKTLYDMGDPTVESIAPVATEAEPEPEEYTGRTDITVNADAIATVATPDCFNGFWTAFSDAYELADGASVNIKFKNYSSSENNWNNFLVGLINTQTTADLLPSADNYEGYLEYGILRADAYGWGFAADPVYTLDWDWANYAAIMREVDVDMTLTRTEGAVSLAATLTTPDGAVYNYGVEMSTTAAAGDPMYFFLTCEHAYLEIMSVE